MKMKIIKFRVISMLLFVGMMILAGCLGPTRVEVAEVQQVQLPFRYEAEGQLIALHKAAVVPEISGVIKQFHVHKGDFVKKGDLVATIDGTSFEEQLALARQSTQVPVVTAPTPAPDSREQEAADLLHAGIITQKEYNKIVGPRTFGATSAPQQDLSEVVEAMEYALAHLQLYAPIDGTVTAIYEEDSKLAMAEHDLMLIQQSSPVEGVFPLQSTILAYVRDDLENVSVYVNTAEGVIQGKMTAVDLLPAGEGMGRAEFVNNGRIQPGGLYKMYLEKDDLYPVLAIPQQALHQDGDGYFVYVVTADNVVDVRYVKVGQQTKNVAAIVDGLRLGETVIVSHGSFKLGERVKR